MPKNFADRKKYKKKLIVFYILLLYVQPFLGNALTLTWILMKDSTFSGNFTWNIVFWKLFRCVFSLVYLNKRCKLVCTSNCPKQGFLAIFCILFPSLQKSEKKEKKYWNPHNRCEIFRRIQIWAQNFPGKLAFSKVILKSCSNISP